MVSLVRERVQREFDPEGASDNINNKRSSPVDESKVQGIIAASGISVRLWRLYACFWFVCLVFPVFFLIQTPPSGFTILLTVSGITIFVSTYFWVMWPHPVSYRARTRLQLPSALALVVILTVLVLFLSILNGSTFLWLFIGVSAIAGITLSFRNVSIAVMSLTLLTVTANVGLDKSITSANWLQIIPLALLVRGLGLDMIGFVRLSDALRELQKAREDLAHQAVTEERLRMARDLHDLLGHSLSLITLKSDLAGRLLEKDARAATQEVHEVERVARQALREVREAVAGYRQRTLRGELEGARQILEAAGIDGTIEYKPQSLPPDIDMVLAWIVREAVTNVIRHSRARHCLIRILSDDAYLRAEIRNDGSPRTEGSNAGGGNGLSGLAERLAKVGGALTALLQLEDDLEVVAEVSQGDQVLPTTVKTKPDIALLDIEMPGSDGLSAAESLHKSLPSCRIVILTTFGRSGSLRRSMESGAVGFLLKDAPADQLAVAIRRVMAGERVVDPDLALSALSDGDIHSRVASATY